MTPDPCFRCGKVAGVTLVCQDCWQAHYLPYGEKALKVLTREYEDARPEVTISARKPQIEGRVSKAVRENADKPVKWGRGTSLWED